VRVQVDGAQSPLGIGASGTFDSPAVDLGAVAAAAAPAAKKTAARKTTPAPKQQGS
jgi:hypothetical protein